jgi:hypothetical protein
LFWGWMWICVSVCEYLLIWCDKTTVHEINDCGSITDIWMLSDVLEKNVHFCKAQVFSHDGGWLHSMNAILDNLNK